MWEPQPGPQSSAITADWCDEIFFGGERGGGKSDFQLGYQEDGALQYKDKWRGIMFRKTYPELEELQARATEIFPIEGAVFKTQPSAGFPFSNCWYWPNGASVKMRYIENERDYGRYHGHQYTGISFDEVTEYATQSGILKMISTLRSPYGVPCSMRLTGNPGGIGHGWVKERYINVSSPYKPYVDPDTGFTRMFIPSRTSDNRILMQNDPSYRERLLAATSGNDALRRAWLEGDWNIIAGAFFECWRDSRNVVRPFEIPTHWLRFVSGDWGSARPFSFGWWAVVSDDFHTESGLILPRGCLVRYREWYGVRRDKSGAPIANEGLKLTADYVGEKLPTFEKDEVITYRVLDPSAFSEDGGPSIHERMYFGSNRKCLFKRADNARVARLGSIGGWDQMRSRLIGEDEQRPMAVCFSTCTDSIRTIPMLQHDKDRIEDLNSDGEDHAADDWRYACMSRPYIKEAPKKHKVDLFKPQTLNELLNAKPKQQGRNRI